MLATHSMFALHTFDGSENSPLLEEHFVAPVPPRVVITTVVGSLIILLQLIAVLYYMYLDLQQHVVAT